MNIHRRNLPLEARILLVWDGTKQFLSSADRLIRQLRGERVFAIHPMPHESIYNYGSVNCLSGIKPHAAERLEKKYRRQTRHIRLLQESSFELLIGDRIDEIVIAAAQLQTKFVLMPRFEQSTFSRWMHGDLNEKIKARATCPVIFLESASCNPGSSSIPLGSSQESS